jgi:hypothetical protein
LEKIRLDEMRSSIHDIVGRFIGEGVIAVLLFGSVASGDVHSGSDIDMVVVDDVAPSRFANEPFTVNDVSVDLWRHSMGFYDELFANPVNPGEMYQKSLLLGILQNCEILYDPNETFERLMDKAKNWRWPDACRDHILSLKLKGEQMKHDTSDEFESLLINRKMVLLNTCLQQMDEEKPISNRAKDLYKYRKGGKKQFESAYGECPNKESLSVLIPEVLDMFREEFGDRAPITELEDATKHLSQNEAFLSAISLQNGAYYVGSRGLMNRGVRLESRGYLNPEAEIELVRKARESWPEFYMVYKKTH